MSSLHFEDFCVENALKNMILNEKNKDFNAFCHQMY